MVNGKYTQHQYVKLPFAQQYTATMHILIIYCYILPPCQSNLQSMFVDWHNPANQLSQAVKTQVISQST